MAWGPQDSAIKIEKGSELETAIANAKSSEEVVALMRDAMLQQQLVVEDVYNKGILYATEQPRQFSKQVMVDGVRISIDGATEAEVLAKENRMMQEIAKQHPAATAATSAAVAATTAATTTATTQDQPRGTDGRFVERAPVADAATKAALALQLQLGQITVDQYLEKSGAIGEYLEQQGVDINAMREVSGQRFTQSWEEASEAFRQATPDWPGGDANLQAISDAIVELGLTDNPSPETLTRAWEHLKATNKVADNPETDAQQSYEKEISECRTQVELDEVTARWFPDSRSARSNRQLW